MGERVSESDGDKVAAERTRPVADLRDYQSTGIAVTLFDIRRHVSINGREPNALEAKRLYMRWFRVDPDGQAVA